MIRRAAVVRHVAGVLVPAETVGGVGVRTLHDILVEEEVGVGTQRRATDVGHRLAEEDGAEQWRLALAFVGEVALAAPAEAERVDPRRVHPGILARDEPRAFGAEQIKRFAEEQAAEDGIALGGEAHAITSSMRTTRFSRALISAAIPMATARKPSSAVTSTTPRPRTASMKAASW